MGEVTRLTNLTTGGPVHVYVKDGRIMRITPLQLDESDGPSWTIEARGRTFTPPPADHSLPLHGRPPLDHLLAQAHSHAAKEGGFRPPGRS